MIAPIGAWLYTLLAEVKVHTLALSYNRQPCGADLLFDTVIHDVSFNQNIQKSRKIIILNRFFIQD